MPVSDYLVNFFLPAHPVGFGFVPESSRALSLAWCFSSKSLSLATYFSTRRTHTAHATRCHTLLNIHDPPTCPWRLELSCESSNPAPTIRARPRNQAPRAPLVSRFWPLLPNGTDRLLLRVSRLLSDACCLCHHGEAPRRKELLGGLNTSSIDSSLISCGCRDETTWFPVPSRRPISLVSQTLALLPTTLGSFSQSGPPVTDSTCSLSHWTERYSPRVPPTGVPARSGQASTGLDPPMVVP